MLRFHLFGFPVRVDPWFWLVSALLGGAIHKLGQPGGATEVVLWVGMVFVSILWHELGHAFAMRRFGSRAEIFLNAGGGLAASSGRFTRREDFIVSAAGPIAGLLLGLPFWLYARSGALEPGLFAWCIVKMCWINVIWSLVNCLPTLPLDGGHMLQAVLGGGKERVVATCGVVSCAAMIAYSLFELHSIFVAVMFGIFLFHNVQFYKNPWQQPPQTPI